MEIQNGKQNKLEVFCSFMSCHVMTMTRFHCLVPELRSTRFGQVVGGTDTSPKRVVTSQRIEREGLGKSRTGTTVPQWGCSFDG